MKTGLQYILDIECIDFHRLCDNFSCLREVIGKYIRDDRVAHHHQQVEAFSKKTMSSVPLQYSDKCFPIAVLWDSALPTLLCSLFIHTGMGGKGMVDIIWHGYWLVCPALKSGQEDRFRHNSTLLCLYTMAYGQCNNNTANNSTVNIKDNRTDCVFMKQNPPAWNPSTW